MIKRILVALVIITNSNIHTDTYKAEVFADKDTAFFLISQRHPERLECIKCEDGQLEFKQKYFDDSLPNLVDLLKASEKKGEPFHVIIEHTNPLVRAFDEDVHKGDLLSEFLPRAQTELKGTVVEDIEKLRKFSTLAESLLLCRGSSTSVVAKLIDEENSLSNDIIEYIGKPLAEVDFNDVLGELKDLLQMAVGLRDKCSSDKILFKRLDSELQNSITFMKRLDFTIKHYEIDCSTPLLYIDPKKAPVLYRDFNNIHKRFFNTIALKRMLELKELAKQRILVIAGDGHTINLRNHLIATQKYKKLCSVGLEDKIGSRAPMLTADQLKEIFNISLLDFFLAESLEEERKVCEITEAMRRRKTILGVLLVCAVVSYSAKVLASFLAETKS